MFLEEKISSFDALGNFLKKLDNHTFDELAYKVVNNNNWFTPEHTRIALAGLSNLLEENKLRNWLLPYPKANAQNSRSVGLIMAGNVPAVGFHDLLCVLIAGHTAHVKLSATDGVLIPWLMEKLFSISPEIERQVVWSERLNGMDAYIATGSDNSARYFNYYFGKYPHIIRKNRTSVAILDGKETDDDLAKLTDDIFLYFGLGCRNVSKIYIKDPIQLQQLLQAADKQAKIIDHHKYLNNYEYNKSIYLVNQEPHLDNGFLLVRESKELVSPIAVLFYELYNSQEELSLMLDSVAHKIQCTVSRQGWFPGSVSMGQAQFPSLGDYADQKDTLKFLLDLD
ncbi:acyl-CoA reductase [Lunatibacter salilacus]|uniref:acyl-CoA reductase n=1 Tax=Lunatibacter salilacus TaxID=2483804 RepID=UPI00131CA935|nr:acyl-CoA reductase [Lunatibacter salilacus]